VLYMRDLSISVMCVQYCMQYPDTITNVEARHISVIGYHLLGGINISKSYVY